MSNIPQTVDFESTIGQIYHQLNGMDSYVPSAKVNALFGSLVSNVIKQDIKVDHQNCDLCGLNHLKSNLHSICSRAEAELELYWAKQIVSSDNPEDALKKFPYYENYCKLVEIEAKLLHYSTSNKGSDCSLWVQGHCPCLQYY